MLINDILLLTCKSWQSKRHNKPVLARNKKRMGSVHVPLTLFSLHRCGSAAVLPSRFTT